MMENENYETLKNEFFKNLNNIIDSTEQCAYFFYEIYKNHKSKLPEIRQFITPEFENNLLAVARKELLPEFLLAETNKTKILSKYPLDDQIKYFRELEPLDVYDGNDSHNKYNINQMSPKQFEMVFHDQITLKRSLEQQKVFFNTKKSDKKMSFTQSYQAKLKDGIRGANIGKKFYTLEQVNEIVADILKL